MSAHIKTLRIGLKQPYSPPSGGNPYQARIEISHRDSTLETVLSQEAMQRVLALVTKEIAEAATDAAQDFAAGVLALDGKAETPQIEETTE